VTPRRRYLDTRNELRPVHDGIELGVIIVISQSHTIEVCPVTRQRQQLRADRIERSRSSLEPMKESRVSVEVYCKHTTSDE
jgi:hypothetical protein